MTFEEFIQYFDDPRKNLIYFYSKERSKLFSVEPGMRLGSLPLLMVEESYGRSSMLVPNRLFLGLQEGRWIFLKDGLCFEEQGCSYAVCSDCIDAGVISQEEAVSTLNSELCVCESCQCWTTSF